MALLSRRSFLISGTALGGGIVLGYVAMPSGTPSVDLREGETLLNAFVKIAEDGRVIMIVPQAEMGQGVYTSLPMLLAEELEVDWQRVAVEHAPVDAVYANPALLTASIEDNPDITGLAKTVGLWTVEKVVKIMGNQTTGGSTSIRQFHEPLRVAGAAARDMLIRAAADRWGVAVEDCFADRGQIVHRPTDRRLGYGELAAAAATLSPPASPKLKARGEYRLIGTSARRLDTPAKVKGTATFGIDVRLPDMAYAAIKAAPTFGGVVDSYDATAIAGMPGVQTVVALGNSVAVVADHYWQAKKALEALPVSFTDGGNGDLDSATIRQRYTAALDREGFVYEDKGDVAAAFADVPAERLVEATYEVPFLAHSCMEPMNATARVADGRCEVWAPNQTGSGLREGVARLLDMPQRHVTVHTTYLGGGFGRRADVDYALQAALIAREAAGRPVQLVWSREMDVQHDVYRPAGITRMRGVLGEDGLPQAVFARSVSQSAMGSYMERNLPAIASHEPDPTSAEGLIHMPYTVANRRVEHVLERLPVPVGFWRSVGNSQNAFFKESFIDEMATAAGLDPIDYRRRLLSDAPRHRAVLELLVQKAGIGGDLGPGRGRGVALHRSFGSIVGELAEVTVDGGEVRVDRVVCVIDCGEVVNPDTVVAQMESGIVYGLTAALYGEITLTGGAVDQSNFHDYPAMTLYDAPAIETHILESGDGLGGVGEPSTPPIAPAVTNAVFDATGVRVRSLPLINQPVTA